MKILLTIAALLVLAVPAASAAPPVGDSKSPAKACKAERTAKGIAEFSDTYGKNDNKKNAFGKCVSAKAKEKAKGKDEEKDEEEQEAKATKMCKAERTAKGIAEFNDTYGKNDNKKNAFGKCVSKHSKSG